MGRFENFRGRVVGHSNSGNRLAPTPQSPLPAQHNTAQQCYGACGAAHALPAKAVLTNLIEVGGAGRKILQQHMMDDWALRRGAGTPIARLVHGPRWETWEAADKEGSAREAAMHEGLMLAQCQLLPLRPCLIRHAAEALPVGILVYHPRVASLAQLELTLSQPIPAAQSTPRCTAL